MAERKRQIGIVIPSFDVLNIRKINPLNDQLATWTAEQPQIVVEHRNRIEACIGQFNTNPKAHTALGAAFVGGTLPSMRELAPSGDPTRQTAYEAAVSNVENMFVAGRSQIDQEYSDIIDPTKPQLVMSRLASPDARTLLVTCAIYEELVRNIAKAKGQEIPHGDVIDALVNISQTNKRNPQLAEFNNYFTWLTKLNWKGKRTPAENSWQRQEQTNRPIRGFSQTPYSY